MNNNIYFKKIDDPDIKNIFCHFQIDISRKNEISITNLLQFIDDYHDHMIFGNEESGVLFVNQ